MNEWLQAQYNEFKGRPDFVRTLKNRLREIKNLNYSGTTDVAVSGLASSTIESTLDFEFDDAAQAAFKHQAPGAFAELEGSKTWIH